MTVRALFMGSDAIALPMLRAVAESRPGSVEWVGVVTQPDRKSGRGMKLQANAIKMWALENGLPVWQPERCGEDEVELIKSLQIDLVIVMAYGQILRENFLQAPRLGVLNLHASLLPKFRGASPIHTAMAVGESETGVSLMRIVRKLDAGPVADQESIAIQPEWTVTNLIEAMSAACVPLMQRALPRLVSGELNFVEQDAAAVTFCRIIEKADGHLDFRLSATELDHRIRAFQPWPGSCFYHGETLIRVLKARIQTAEAEGEPGVVLSSNGDGLCISCGAGVLVVEELQRAGSKAMDVETFLRGYAIAVEERVIGGEAVPLVFDQPFRRKK